MASECQAIQEALSEHRGEMTRLGVAERQHVDSCPGCSEVAAAELALGADIPRGCRTGRPLGR